MRSGTSIAPAKTLMTWHTSRTSQKTTPLEAIIVTSLELPRWWVTTSLFYFSVFIFRLSVFILMNFVNFIQILMVPGLTFWCTRLKCVFPSLKSIINFLDLLKFMLGINSLFESSLSTPKIFCHFNYSFALSLTMALGL